MNKKFTVFLLVSMFLPLICHGQRLEDFTKTQSSKVTYDELFEPTLHLTFKNVSNKVITTVEVIIYYDKGLDPYEWRYPTRSKTIQIRIGPNEYGTVKVSTPKEVEGRKPGHYLINKIRFEDGSICDR